jgi:hypothetical protein
MNVPLFNAEASLYRTGTHYVQSGAASLSAGGSAITPQSCGWIKGITCGAAIAGGTALCTASCFAGPAACAACWAGALAIVGYGFCKDCIPAWMRALIDTFEGGGGGGGGGGSTGGGGGGRPHPRPIGCDPGEKCCEHDAEGNCTLCIPHNFACP